MSIFQEGDKKKRIYNTETERYEDYLREPREDEITSVVYTASREVVLARLDVMGFTHAALKADFERGVTKELNSLMEDLPPDYRNDEFYDHQAEHIDILQDFTFDAFVCGGKEILEKDLKSWNDDHNRNDIAASTSYMLDEHYEMLYGYPGTDIRFIIRMFCEVAQEGSNVSVDLSDIIGGGWVKEDIAFASEAKKNLVANYPADTPTIILTEGSTDIEFIKAGIELLFPYLVDYYTFFDFPAHDTPGSAGDVVKYIKAFASAGVSNRILAVFDNDTAATDAICGLETLDLPVNITYSQYPRLGFLESYPTLGPTGQAAMDVNGSAASIELYLGTDVLLGSDGTLTPIQWTGYNRRLRRYQGEVLDKRAIQDRFRQKITECRRDRTNLESSDWSGMRAIIEMIIQQ